MDTREHLVWEGLHMSIPRIRQIETSLCDLPGAAAPKPRCGVGFWVAIAFMQTYVVPAGVFLKRSLWNCFSAVIVTEVVL